MSDISDQDTPDLLDDLKALAANLRQRTPSWCSSYDIYSRSHDTLQTWHDAVVTELAARGYAMYPQPVYVKKPPRRGKARTA